MLSTLREPALDISVERKKTPTDGRMEAQPKLNEDEKVLAGSILQTGYGDFFLTWELLRITQNVGARDESPWCVVVLSRSEGAKRRRWIISESEEWGEEE